MARRCYFIGGCFMKKMKKAGLLTLLLVFLLFLTFFAEPVHAGKSPFKDVKESDWFFQYVVNLEKGGIISGYPDGTFRPNEPVIRKHAAKMIANAAGLKGSGKSVKFTDFTSQDPMAPYVDALIKVGAIKGYPDGSFRPNEKIKRGHVCKMVMKAFNLEVKNWVPGFIDYPPDTEVRQAIGTLGADHIVKGYQTSAGWEFRPDASVTRAQLAKILCLSMAVAATEKANSLRTIKAVEEAQALVDALPHDQDPTLIDSLNNWLFDILDDINTGLYGNYYWRDVEAINRLIRDNELAWDLWKPGVIQAPGTWFGAKWTGSTLKRIERINFPHNYEMSGTVDLDALTELRELKIFKNQVTKLKVNGCHKLEVLLCYENKLTSLDLSGLSSLKNVDCSYNKDMISLNLKGCSALIHVTATACNLYGIGWDALPALETLACSNNKLEGTLDVSGFANLIDLRCTNNKLTGIRLRPFFDKPFYQYISVSHNLLKSPKDIVNGGLYPWDEDPNFVFSPQK